RRGLHWPPPVAALSRHKFSATGPDWIPADCQPESCSGHLLGPRWQTQNFSNTNTRSALTGAEWVPQDRVVYPLNGDERGLPPPQLQRARLRRFLRQESAAAQRTLPP